MVLQAMLKLFLRYGNIIMFVDTQPALGASPEEARPMSDSAPAWSTGMPDIDATLGRIGTAFAQAFPGRVRAAYLVGSYHEGTAVPLSDIDCCLIFAGRWASEGEQAQTKQLADALAGTSSVRLDLLVWPEDAIHELYPGFQVALKLGSALVYGADLRARIALPPRAAYAADVAAGARFFIARLRGSAALTDTQVAYPDAADEFFGYTRKSIAAWYPEAVAAGTKELVATVSRIATARLVAEAELYVPGKQAAFALYGQHIGSAWAALVAQVFGRCKRDWQYLVPETAAERAELRRICRELLAFENDFLARYPA